MAETREDELIRRQGELVRTIRRLAASEVAMRTKLEQIAREYGHVLGPACGYCPGCVAKDVLAAAGGPVDVSRAIPKDVWEKC